MRGGELSLGDFVAPGEGDPVKVISKGVAACQGGNSKILGETGNWSYTGLFCRRGIGQVRPSEKVWRLRVRPWYWVAEAR